MSPGRIRIPRRPRTIIRGRRFFFGVALGTLVGALSLYGCDGVIGLGQPEREEARARVTTDPEGLVRIVTSTNFSVISFQGGPDGEPQVELATSDTVVLTPPWEETFDIRATRRFYIQVSAADTNDITGNLEVFIDDELRADLTSELQERPLTNLFVQQR